jgi:hypothetical protein
LHVGGVFSKAVQHSTASHAAGTALLLLQCLLSAAAESGLIKDGAAVGSLGSTMQQQLQDSGVLQQYAVVLAALAADLRSEAAGLAGLSWDQVSPDLDTFSQLSECVECIASPYPHFSNLWRSLGHSAAAAHAEAAMQLCTAGLQHSSSVLQHVLSAVQQRAPQEAAALLNNQYTVISSVMELGNRVMLDLMQPASTQVAASSQQGQSSTGTSLPVQAQQQQQQHHHHHHHHHQALMSPHCLPFAVSMLVVTVSWISKCCSQQAVSNRQGRGGANSTSSSGCEDGDRQPGRTGAGCSSSSGCDSRSRRQVRQHAAATAGHAGASGGGNDTTVSCQQQLMKLLGLAHQLSDMAELLIGADSDSPSQLLTQFILISQVFTQYYQAIARLPRPPHQQSDLVGGVYENVQQRWQFEQQLWLLLLPALLPCANSILLPVTGTGRSRMHPCEAQRCVGMLIEHSDAALSLHNKMQAWLGGSLRSADLLPLHHAWMGEVLGELLQLADKLLLQQPQAEPPANAATAAVAAAPSRQLPAGQQLSHNSAQLNSATDTVLHGVFKAGCTVQLLRLLSRLVIQSPAWFPSTTAHLPGELGRVTSNAAVYTTEAPAAPAAPPVADRYVEVCTALEAAVRAVTTAVRHGVWQGSSGIDTVVRGLLVSLEDADPSAFPDRLEPALVLHLGLCGPEALLREQRQLYSLLSTVQKLSCCKAAGEVCWSWATAEVAVRLLQKGLSAGSETASTAGWGCTGCFGAAACSGSPAQPCHLWALLPGVGRASEDCRCGARAQHRSAAAVAAGRTVDSHSILLGG